MLSFFDCNCSFGNTVSVRKGSFSDVADLVNAMQRYSIDQALVYHSLARAYHPVPGNDLLIEQIANYSQLYPVWAVMPNHTDEFYFINELLDRMKANNVKAVRLFPSEHGFSISAWCCGELWRFLQSHRVPVMLEMDSLTVSDLFWLGSEYPDLRIILIDVGYRADRNLYPLMQQLPNLYVQSAGYRVCNGIEILCERFGAERIIFGSGMPVASGASAITMLYYAKISLEDKRKIASQNLSKMLGEVRL